MMMMMMRESQKVHRDTRWLLWPNHKKHTLLESTHLQHPNERKNKEQQKQRVVERVTLVTPMMVADDVNGR